MKNDFVDPKVTHMNFMNFTYCMAHGGSKDCFGLLHKISFNLYDENELTDENRYAAKIHFKCKCDKCGYETFLTYDPDTPTILY